MSDTFGHLELPAPVPADGEALTDATLDMLLDFMKSVINHDLGDAWSSRAPADPEPVAHVFAHNPDEEAFESNSTPALYAWRNDDNQQAVHRYTQDLTADESTIMCLWVPPPASQENRREREAIRNGIKKSLKKAFAQGRHPAWVIPGDDYYDPETYGSVLLKHTKLAKCRLAQFRAHTLQLEVEDGSRGPKTTFDCLMFTIETLEFLQTDDVANGTAQALDAHEATFHLAAKITDANGDEYLSAASGDTLDVNTAHVEFELLAIDVSTGSSAGGEVVALTCRQAIDAGDDGPRVYFGDTLSPYVVVQNETTILATTPPHAAGVVDVSVEQVEGSVRKTLAASFTFT